MKYTMILLTVALMALVAFAEQEAESIDRDARYLAYGSSYGSPYYGGYRYSSPYYGGYKSYGSPYGYGYGYNSYNRGFYGYNGLYGYNNRYYG